MSSTTVKEYTREEVARHNTPQSLWVVIDSAVYDLTTFAGIQSALWALYSVVVVMYVCVIFRKMKKLWKKVDLHPGGAAVLRDVAGQDATTAFYNLHRHEVLGKYPFLFFLHLANHLV